jgi:CRP-like cAMP-binding protein
MLEAIISKHQFFKELHSRYLDVIVGCASNVVFQPSDMIFREGGEANRFYLIREGLVSLDVFIPGRGPVSVQTIAEGEVLGWSWLFAPYRWHFDARSIGLTRAISFETTCLRAKSDADHELGYELMKRFARIMMQRLQATRLQMLDIYALHTT